MILFILKIIGILLLVIAGILLLAVLAILFVPIRYKSVGAIHEGVIVWARLSWFLHCVVLHISYQGEKIVQKIKIFGIPIYDSSRPQKLKGPKKSKKKKKRIEPLSNECENPSGITEAECISQKDKKPSDDQAVEYREDKKNEKEKGFWGKIKEFLKALLQFIKNMQYTIQSFCDKIKKVVSNVAYYKEILEKEATKNSFLQCKKQLFKVWKNIKPGKLKIRVHFGFDDPALTGQILVIHSMFYPWIYNSIVLEPDFEEIILEGDYYFKGRITIFVMLKAAWILYFDKDIRKFLKLLNREEL